MTLKKDLDKFYARNEQIKCLDFIKKTYESDNSKRFYLLNLPPGVGKSYLSLMISDFYFKSVNKFGKCDVITNSKILQDQYTNTFESIKDLRGKENYTCEKYNCSCAQGTEFGKLAKDPCEVCPYKESRNSFMEGKVSLTNFYLYSIWSIYTPELLKTRDASLLIVDECHDLESVISNFLSVKITENTLKKYDFPNEVELIRELKSIKSTEDYFTFLKKLILDINEVMSELSQMVNDGKNSVQVSRKNKISKLLNKKSKDINILENIKDLEQLSKKIEVFFKEWEKDSDNWILETSWNETSKNYDISLEPIWISTMLWEWIFSKYDMVFLMSGTILNKKIFCDINGIESEKSVYYSINSPFPLKNRPIYYLPSGKMSFKNKEETFKNYVPVISKILEKYSGKKGIIHTNSFELTSWIMKSIKNRRLITHNSKDKDIILNEHFKTDKDTVIVSPSVDTGVSFDDDWARFQIISKIPFPSLASKRNKIRMQINPEWYQYQTIIGIIQMSGRIVRSSNDWGDTIIIDSSFSDILKRSSYLIPNWFLDSIKIKEGR
jgi:ATP-dependent DNA helicase DinG